VGGETNLKEKKMGDPPGRNISSNAKKRSYDRNDQHVGKKGAGIVVEKVTYELQGGGKLVCLKQERKRLLKRRWEMRRGRLIEV